MFESCNKFYYILGGEVRCSDLNFYNSLVCHLQIRCLREGEDKGIPSSLLPTTTLGKLKFESNLNDFMIRVLSSNQILLNI